MKFITTLLLILMTTFSFGNDFYNIIEKDGHPYIQITKNLDSFIFKTDFGSVGNSGKIEVFVNNESKGEFKKSDGKIEAKDLKKGDTIGLYLHRNNGQSYEWNISKDLPIVYFAKNKNGKDE